jgi:Ulp1 family protease
MFRNGNHFSLFLVVNPNLIGESKCKILLLDSLNHARENLSTEETKDVLRIKLLITEWYNFVNGYGVVEHVQIFDSITTLKLTKIPQQSDGSSCGWYCILFAKFAVGT